MCHSNQDSNYILKRSEVFNGRTLFKDHQLESIDTMILVQNFLSLILVVCCFVIQFKGIPTDAQETSTSPSPDVNTTDDGISVNQRNLFGFNFQLNLGRPRQFTTSLSPYQQSVVEAYCRGLLNALGRGIPTRPPVLVVDPPPIAVQLPPKDPIVSPPVVVPGALRVDDGVEVNTRRLRDRFCQNYDLYSGIVSYCTDIITARGRK